MDLLPVPRLPHRTNRLPSADAVAEMAGEDAAAPLREMDRIFREAQQAVLAVESRRPGGQRWREALEEDRQRQMDESKPAPKQWAVERCLAGDMHRWATASAACRSLSAQTNALIDAIDRDAIAAACWDRLLAAEGAFTLAVVEAQKVLGDGARTSVVQAAYEAVEEHLAAWQRAGSLWRWAVDRSSLTTPQRDALEALSHGLPGGRVGGAFLALRSRVTGKRMITFPNHVTFSTDSDLLAAETDAETLHSVARTEAARAIS